MKINGLSSNFYTEFRVKKQKITSFGNNKLTTDVVDIDPLARKENIAKRIFEEKGKFDIERYKALSKTEKEAIREVSHTAVKLAAQENLDQGLKLKAYLDSFYGKGKYVFVCIGTSPSCLARVMEFSGVETKYLPISGLGRAINYENIKKKILPADEYINFLHQQGLSNEEIEKSNKHYLFFDYTNSGKTMEFFEQIMSQDFGIDSPMIEYLSLADELQKANSKIFSKDTSEEYIRKYLNLSYAEHFGGIPHLHYSELSDINETIKTESQRGKQYNFFIIDALSKRKLAKDNPKNKGVL